MSEQALLQMNRKQTETSQPIWVRWYENSQTEKRMRNEFSNVHEASGFVILLFLLYHFVFHEKTIIHHYGSTVEYSCRVGGVILCGQSSGFRKQIIIIQFPSCSVMWRPAGAFPTLGPAWNSPRWIITTNKQELPWNNSGSRKKGVRLCTWKPLEMS